MECRLVLIAENGELRQQTFDLDYVLRAPAMDVGLEFQEAFRALFLNMPLEPKAKEPAMPHTADAPIRRVGQPVDPFGTDNAVVYQRAQTPEWVPDTIAPQPYPTTGAGGTGTTFFTERIRAQQLQERTARTIAQGRARIAQYNEVAAQRQLAQDTLNNLNTYAGQWRFITEAADTLSAPEMAPQQESRDPGFPPQPLPPTPPTP